MMNNFKISLLINNLQDAQKVKEYRSQILPTISSFDFEQDPKMFMQIIQELKKDFSIISVALGENGNLNNWKKVLEIARENQLLHVNMPLSKIKIAQTILGPKFLINGLIELGIEEDEIIIDQQIISIAMLEQKYNLFTLKSLKCLNLKQENWAVNFTKLAKVCQKYHLIIEPAGGIGKQKFLQILKIAKTNKVKMIIPHIFNLFFNQAKQINWELVDYFIKQGKGV